MNVTKPKDELDQLKHFYEEWQVPVELRPYKQFFYECENLWRNKEITKGSVWCKNITAFRKLIKLWNKKNDMYKYFIRDMEEEKTISVIACECGRKAQDVDLDTFKNCTCKCGKDLAKS